MRPVSRRSRIGRLAGVLGLALVGGLLVPAAATAAPAPVAGELEIANHGFEDGLTGWSPTDGRGGEPRDRCAAPATVAADWSDQGAHSLAFAGRPPCVTAGMRSEPVEVTAGAGYSVFAHAGRVTGESAGRVSLGIEFYDASDRLVGSDRGTLVTADAVVEHTATAPTGAVRARVEIGASRAVRVDTVLLTGALTMAADQITKRGSFLAMAAGYDQAGRAATFAVVTGNAAQPAVLVMTDILTGEVTDTVELPGATGSWTVEYDHLDGTVYVGTYSSPAVYSWKPGAPEVTRLGTPPLAHLGFVYGLSATGDGRLYGGGWGEPTAGYAGAQLWRWDAEAGFSAFGPSPLTEEAMYTRAVGYDDVTDSVWAGTGTVSGLYGCRTDTEQCTDFTELLPQPVRDLPWVYGITAGGGYVQVWGGDSASTGNDHLVVLDVGTGPDGELAAEVVADVPGVIYNGSTPVVDDTVYYTKAGTSPELWLHALDVTTGEERRLDAAPTGIFSRQWELLDLRDPQWPGLSVVGWNSGGYQVAYNLATERFSRVQVADIPDVATAVNAITSGPGGRIWSAGHLTGGLGAQGPMRSDEQVTYPVGGQAENMITYQGRIWQGTYPSGRIESFTPAEIAAGAAPRVDCVIGEDQNRPYGLVGHEGRIYYGSQADYGADHGAFGWLDLDTGECTTLVDPIGALSVNSLTAVDGVVVGGTSIFYGWDSEPVLDRASLLVHDIAAATTELVATPVPVRAIDAVVTDADGIVWAFAQGWLFGYDPVAGDWVHSEHAFAGWESGARVAGNHATMILADDLVYGVAGGRVFSFEPGHTLRHGSAAPRARVWFEGAGPRLTLDEYGTLHVIAGQTRLVRIDPRTAESWPVAG